LGDLPENEERRLQDAFRNSMMARGMVEGMETIVKFNVRSQQKEKAAVTYA
jgi:hypothetical protein